MFWTATTVAVDRAINTARAVVNDGQFILEDRKGSCIIAARFDELALRPGKSCSWAVWHSFICLKSFKVFVQDGNALTEGIPCIKTSAHIDLWLPSIMCTMLTYEHLVDLKKMKVACDFHEKDGLEVHLDENIMDKIMKWLHLRPIANYLDWKNGGRLLALLHSRQLDDDDETYYVEEYRRLSNPSPDATSTPVVASGRLGELERVLTPAHMVCLRVRALGWNLASPLQNETARNAAFVLRNQLLFHRILAHEIVSNEFCSSLAHQDLAFLHAVPTDDELQMWHWIFPYWNKCGAITEVLLEFNVQNGPVSIVMQVFLPSFLPSFFPSLYSFLPTFLCCFFPPLCPFDESRRKGGK